MVSQALFSSATDLWYTPQWLFDLLDREFNFDLDVCALPENTKCKRFFSPAQDGLAMSWGGARAWMNPPYGRGIGSWVKRAHEAVYGDEFAEVAVCLLPARTDTRWWWEYCRFGEVRFLPGRLKFGGSVNSAPFPSAVVIFDFWRPASVQWWEVKQDVEFA